MKITRVMDEIENDFKLSGDHVPPKHGKVTNPFDFPPLAK
jgi:hypothetical protein